MSDHLTSMVPSSRIVRSSLADDVLADLVERIVDEEYAAGSPIPTEAELAAQFNVGRSTVREAVKGLVSTGLVEIRRGRGTYVLEPARWSPFDPSLLRARSRTDAGRQATTRKLLEARTLVEVGVAELAAVGITRAGIARLDQAAQRMERATRIEEFVQADLDFHQGLLDAADNPYVHALFQPIEALIHDERVETSRPIQLWPPAIEAHRRILTAVEQGDPVAARREMAAHLTQTAELMERHWRNERRRQRPSTGTDR